MLQGLCEIKHIECAGQSDTEFSMHAGEALSSLAPAITGSKDGPLSEDEPTQQWGSQPSLTHLKLEKKKNWPQPCRNVGGGKSSEKTKLDKLELDS